MGVTVTPLNAPLAQGKTPYRWLHSGYTEPRNNKAQPGELG